MQELYPLMAEAEVLVLAAPIYYFTLNAQIQAPIQRMYCVNSPAKVKKMALLMSSYSPGVYDGAKAEYRDICNYWKVEDTGIVTATFDEQKTDATRQKIQDLVGKL
jgi:multimeric flavodoxin WrbA